MSEPVDFLTVPMAGGGRRKDLTRLTDGSVLCCICFDRFRMDELNPVGGGKVEDVCKQCAGEEMMLVSRNIGHAEGECGAEATSRSTVTDDS